MQSSFSDLEYAAKKKVTRRDRFLAEIETITPWAALEAEIDSYYPKGGGRGRPPIGLGRMLRMYIAQQCFGLSDEGIEDAIYDSQAIRRFVGIDLSREDAPDATTLLKFRRENRKCGKTGTDHGYGATVHLGSVFGRHPKCKTSPLVMRTLRKCTLRLDLMTRRESDCNI